MIDIFFQDYGRMANFSPQHLWSVVFFAVVGFFVIHFANTKLNHKQQKRLGDALAWSLTATIIGWTLLKIAIQDFDPSTEMPLAICNLIALTMPVMMIRKNQWWFEVFYFLAIGGTLQAVITPDLSTAFPHFSFFKYWYVHCMVIIVTLYAVLVYKMRPRLKSILKVYLAINVYVGLMMIYNFYTGANHLYLMEKPVTATVVDYFGPWPWYIFVAQLIALPVFMVLYLPYFVRDIKSRKNPDAQ